MWVRVGLIGMVLAAVWACGGVAAADEDAEARLGRMAEAAHYFLASLDDEQRGKAAYGFEDEERLDYKTAPFPSGGLKYSEMGEQQKLLLHVLLNASLSASGYGKATSIMALEGYLVEVNEREGSFNRLHGIGKYTATVFGEPTATGTWGWRLQAHHLSLNFTVVEGKFFGSGPAFLGAEPHLVTEGPRAGWHVLGREEKLGRGLMDSFDAGQRAKATIADEMPRDMFTGMTREAAFDGPAAGIAYGDMNSAQQGLLRALVMEYVSNIPRELAYTRLEKVEQGGWENIHFAWIGGIEAPEKNYYRLEGPEFIIEYCAVALTDNHIHTVWRDVNGDFARDLLAEHYEAFEH